MLICRPSGRRNGRRKVSEFAVLYSAFFFNIHAYSQQPCERRVHTDTYLGSPEAGVTVRIKSANFDCSGTTNSQGEFGCTCDPDDYYHIAAINYSDCEQASNDHYHLCWAQPDMDYLVLSQPACGPIQVNEAPKSYRLVQNFPNPFNPTTEIKYDIPQQSFVSLKIYDAAAKEVQTLVNETQNAGSYNVKFNAEQLPSGIYFYTIKAGDFIETKKMLLLK